MNAFHATNYSYKVRDAVEREGYGWDDTWEVKDGDELEILEVDRADIAGAVPMDPCRCPIARAVKGHGLQPVVMKTTALVGDPETKTIFRFDMGRPTRRFVEKFDRGANPGATYITLRPHSPADRIEAHRTRNRVARAASRQPGYVSRPQRPSPVDVRSLGPHA